MSLKDKVNILKENSRGTRPDWDEHFMSLAIRNSSRSSCWFVRSGSKFVYNNEEVASGYNGASAVYKKNCLEGGCAKENIGLEYENSLGSGNCIGMHSEMNGIGHLDRRNSNGLVLYTTIFPCPSCAKNIQPYGIKRVVFKRAYFDDDFDKSMRFFLDSGTRVDQLDLSLMRHWEIDVYRDWKKFDVWSKEESEKAKRIFDGWDKL